MCLCGENHLTISSVCKNLASKRATSFLLLLVSLVSASCLVIAFGSYSELQLVVVGIGGTLCYKLRVYPRVLAVENK